MTQEIITITVEAGQMTARRKYRKIAQRRPVPVWAIVKYAALTIAGIMLFREGAARALAYRGYPRRRREAGRSVVAVPPGIPRL